MFTFLNPGTPTNLYLPLLQILPDFALWGPKSAVFHCDLPAYESLELKCPYGEVFYNRVRAWFCQLQLPVDVHSCVPCTFVGLVELYFDFVMVSGTETPINTGTRQNAIWSPLDQNPLLQSPPVPLSRHTSMWVLFWKWCWKYCGIEFPFKWLDRRPLPHVGYTLFASVISHRPIMACSSSSEAVWRYFHPITGRRRDLNGPLRPLPRP